jgi:hypothetical protein
VAAETALEACRNMAGQILVSTFAAFPEAGKKTRNSEFTAFFARVFKTQSPEFMAEIEAQIGSDIRAVRTLSLENCRKRLKSPQLGALN